TTTATTTDPDITENTDTTSQVNVDRATVNINPKFISKWQSSADAANTYVQDVDTVVRNGITVNTQVPTADGIEIYLPNGTVIKTHDTVKIANGKIIIAGDTFIDGNGNVTDAGSGKVTIIYKDDIKANINGGNQPTYTGSDPDGDALAAYNKSGVKGIIDFLPYMSKNAIDEIARTEYDKVGSLDKLDSTLLAVMSTNLANEFALKESEKSSLKNLPDSVIANMNENTLAGLVKDEYDKNGFNNITYTMIWRIKDDNIFDEIVRTEYAKNGFENLSDTILFWMNKSTLDEFVKDEYEKNGLKNISGTIMYDMNKSTLNELIQEEYEKNGFKNFTMQLYYYMSDSLKAELGIDDDYAALNFVNYDGGCFQTYADLKNGTAIFKFENGIKVTMFRNIGTSINNSTNYVKFLSNCIIEFTNGITVNAPSNTTISEENNIYTITIGGGATITQPDGTSSTVPSGAVLDSEGNIVK
ncbi:MAG: hypothetical protein FWD71_06285, partial [Oscillospiraceae bacterium]|nr:hypothetical protein [Oscillospiraceae bacterium]